MVFSDFLNKISTDAELFLFDYKIIQFPFAIFWRKMNVANLSSLKWNNALNLIPNRNTNFAIFSQNDMANTIWKKQYRPFKRQKKFMWMKFGRKSYKTSGISFWEYFRNILKYGFFKISLQIPTRSKNKINIVKNQSFIIRLLIAMLCMLSHGLSNSSSILFYKRLVTKKILRYLRKLHFTWWNKEI